MMKAAVLEELGQIPIVKKQNLPKQISGALTLPVVSAALNHRDLWIIKGRYANIQLPVILGSDGLVIYQGSRYLINPGLNWGRDQGFQSSEFSILGMPSNGCFAEYVSISEEHLYSVPKHLNDEQAAALPLAGVTAYRAIQAKCQVKAGENVLINGIGGGVAGMAMLFALASGARVWVSSSREEKINKAIKLGAEGGFLYTEDDWTKQAKKSTGGMDAIIDGAAGPGFGDLLKLCRPGARIAIYGGTRGLIGQMSPQILFWKQLNIFGTTMGSPRDFKDMIDFVNLHEIEPIVDSVFPLNRIGEAFQRMEDASHFGKIVISIA